MSKRYALIRDGKVDAVILSDDEKLPRLIAATELKLSQLKAAIDVTDKGVSTGDLYDKQSGEFTRPEPESGPETKTTGQELAELRAKVDALEAARR